MSKVTKSNTDARQFIYIICNTAYRMRNNVMLRVTINVVGISRLQLVILVLQKDSTSSKTFSKWIGPAVIFDVQSPNSYVIEFEDGSKRILHANHLRKFHTRTNPQFNILCVFNG